MSQLRFWFVGSDSEADEQSPRFYHVFCIFWALARPPCREAALAADLITAWNFT